MNESKVEVWLDRFDKETFVVGVRKGGKYDARKVNLWHGGSNEGCPGRKHQGYNGEH